MAGDESDGPEDPTGRPHVRPAGGMGRGEKPRSFREFEGDTGGCLPVSKAQLAQLGGVVQHHQACISAGNSLIHRLTHSLRCRPK